MAVFYNREKSKVGTLTGTIINWSKQLTSNDPSDPVSIADLPAGYLRCDGSILSAEVYPQLAEILGTGAESRYRKPNQTLRNNQFQLPDFGSKKLRASSGSNLGDLIDLYLLDDNDNEITKSGIGLEVQSNIGTTYEIQYQGNFFLPGQTIGITGEPGFTRSTGNYTEISDVLVNAFLPHAHFHDGTRTRIASPSGNEFQPFGRNSYTTRSTLCVVNWANATEQQLCLYQATKFHVGSRGLIQYQSNGFCENVVWGGCFTGCSFLSSYECLIPQGYTCAFPMFSGEMGGCANAASTRNVNTCGQITYSGPFSQRCTSISLTGCNIGGFNGQNIPGTVSLTPNYNFLNVPFDASIDSDRDTYAAVNNTTNQTTAFGNDGSHRHFINFAAQPHTYVVNTRPTFIPAAPLVSTISVIVNTENKADQFIQPYIVQEFLIKY